MKKITTKLSPNRLTRGRVESNEYRPKKFSVCDDGDETDRPRDPEDQSAPEETQRPTLHATHPHVATGVSWDRGKEGES